MQKPVIFLLLLFFCNLFAGTATVYGQDIVTEQERERAREVRENLIELGFLSKTEEDEFPLAFSWHQEPLIVSSIYTNARRSVATSGTRDTAFRPDGSRMYVVGRASRTIAEYHLSTNWDISTRSYVRELDISAEMGSSGTEVSAPHGIYIRDDGNKMWVMNRSEIWEYSLSSSWNITSATQTGYRDLKGESISLVRAHGVDFRPNGRRMYVDDRVVGGVFQYNLSTAWDISTATLDHVLDISDIQLEARGVQLNSTGERMYILDTGRREVLEFFVSNAFDLRSARYIGAYRVGSQMNNPRGMSFNTNFDGFYISDATDDMVYQYRVQIADPNRSTLSVNRSKVIADGSNTSRVTVTIRDENGDRLKEGINVNLSASSASTSINAVNRTTNSSGEARFDVSSSSEGTVTFTARASGKEINQTTSVFFTSVSASQSRVVSNREKV
ncbi:MAG: hypothetical protein EA391_00660, partial [Balneolaceae bacterium]